MYSITKVFGYPNLWTYINETISCLQRISHFLFIDEDTTNCNEPISFSFDKTGKYVLQVLLIKIIRKISLSTQRMINIHILFQEISQLNESVILKGAHFTGFKLWSKNVMMEREWFDKFNTNKINVRK